MIVQAIVSTLALTLTTLLMHPVGSHAQFTPYAGQHVREIKALSPAEIQGYLSGQGMGFAKATELNHYPGPRHVLELAEALQLNEQQQIQTQAIFDAMQQEAIRLGHQLVQAERHLDHLFSAQVATEEAVQAATRTIADYRGKLRHVHLRAHLAQRQVLNADQLQRYDHFRGYNNPAHEHRLHRHQH